MLSYTPLLKEEIGSLNSEYLSNLRPLRKKIGEKTYRSELFESMILQGDRFILGNQEIINNNFQISAGELCCGFYSTEPISFDLYVGDELQYHYTLEPNRFYNIISENKENILLPIINNSIMCAKNIQKSTPDAALYYVGCYLENEERIETIISNVKEIMV